MLARRGVGGQDATRKGRTVPTAAIFLLVVLAILALGFLTWAHYAFWRARFAPSDRPDEIHYVRTADGWDVQLRRYLPRGAGPRYEEPVVLCHGLGANHYNVDWDPPHGIAQYLAEAGRDCWVISLRGHDGSSRPSRRNGLRWGFSFDDHVRDVVAALECVVAKTGASRVQWVGHSMGGMLAYALGGMEHARYLAGGVVALGSPASFADQAYLRWLTRLGVVLARRTRVPQRWLTRMIAPFTGFFDLPFSELAIAPKSMDGRLVRRLQAWVFEDISAGVMRQFHDWVHNDAFRSLDRTVDYKERMRAHRAPFLLVAASADKLAPPPCMERAFALLGSEEKTLRMVGRAHGQSVDYGHGDLLLGRAAPREIYPLVEAWLRERARPRAEARAQAVATDVRSPR